MVQRHAVRELEHPVDDLEARVVDGEDVAVAGVRVDHRHPPDHRPWRLLLDRHIVEQDGGRRLVGRRPPR